jgi:hypothetical protein
VDRGRDRALHDARGGRSRPSDDEADYRPAGPWSLRHGATGLGLTLSAGGDRADGDDPCDLHGELSRDHAFVDRGGTGLGVDPTRGENLPGPGRRVRRRAPGAGAGRGYLKMSSSRFFV